MDTQKSLKFSDIDIHSDIDKKVEGEVDIVKEDSIEKKADLYQRELFTIIPEDHDPSLGIFPGDQQLSNRYVLLWNSIKTITPSIIDKGYKILKIKIASESIITNELRNLGGGVYALKYISNTLPFEEVKSINYTE